MRSTLEEILHPLIAQEVFVQAKAATGIYVVFVVPLLVESGRWRDRIDRLCVVDCEEKTQIERVQARSGIPADTIRRSMAAQATRAERLAAADDIIVNSANTSLAELDKQVLVLHEGWCNLSVSG
jgi:dephospho-CoA kinase